jgi:hypothetical protein
MGGASNTRSTSKISYKIAVQNPKGTRQVQA